MKIGMLPGTRWRKPDVGIGVTVAVPHQRFSPTPNMPEHVVAYHKGAEAARLGQAQSTNPHPHHSELSHHWNAGYRNERR